MIQVRIIYQCQGFYSGMRRHSFTNNITFTIHHIHHTFRNPWKMEMNFRKLNTAYLILFPLKIAKWKTSYEILAFTSENAQA